MIRYNRRNLIFSMVILFSAGAAAQGAPGGPPRVVVLQLDQMVNHVTAEYIVGGIKQGVMMLADHARRPRMLHAE